MRQANALTCRYVPKKEFYRRPMTLAMAEQGPGCFDEQYYMQRNKVTTDCCSLSFSRTILRTSQTRTPFTAA